MAIRVSGLVSGMDTESIVTQLVSAYNVKKNKYVKAQTKLSWKQDAWKTLNKKVKSLYSNMTSLKYSSAYKTKMASVSDTTKASVSAEGTAVNGSYSLKINQVAKSGYLTGGQLAASTTRATKLSELLGDDSFAGGKIEVTSAGKTSTIEVTADTTVSNFVSKLNDAGVKASYDATNQRIYVAASGTGAANDFSLSGVDDNGSTALKALGLRVASKSNTENYKSWAAYDGQDIAQILADLQNSKDAISAANNSITQSRSKISGYTTKVNYASSYETMMNAYKGLDNAGEIRDLDELAAMSKADLSKTYELDDDGNFKRDSEGKLIVADDTVADDKKATGTDHLNALAAKAGLVEKKDENAGEDVKQVTIAEFAAAKAAVDKYDAQAADDTLTADEKADMNDFITSVQHAYKGAADSEYASIEELTNAYNDKITKEQDSITAQNKIISDNKAVLEKYALLDNGEDQAALEARISYAVKQLANAADKTQYNTDATRIDGQDAEIYVNNAKYTSSSNSFSINGLKIEALASTEGSEINVTVKNDVDGVYKKIKDFLKEYNSLINEMTSLYNADSAKGYEPLTTEEKDAMTDSEVEEWEKKVKSALLRRDDSLGNLLNSMTSAMYKGYTVNGKSYSLSSFGISTLGYLNADENEENAYHIDGDADDSAVSSKTNKLKQMLQEDPDTVTAFMQQLVTGVYNEIDTKMRSNSLSSAMTVYNDKQMAKEYSNYTTTIKKWEDKITSMEDSYYKKFAAMETALAKLQQSTSSLSGLLGS